MSYVKNECVPKYYFELNHIALSTNKFQLTEKHDQTQNNILEMHSCSSRSSYMKKFDVRTYIVDLVEYNMCSIKHLKFKRYINAKIKI